MYVAAETDSSLAQKNGANGVEGLALARNVKVSLDGRHVYAAGFGNSAIAVFSRTATTGKLRFVQMVKEGVNGVSGLSDVASLELSPDGGNVYAAAVGSVP